MTPIPCAAPAQSAIPFALPDIGESEINAVVSCLRSGWLTTGSRSAQFERDFARFMGGGVEGVTVASATAGLEIALSAHGIGPGDEVITTDYTFTATAMSAVHLGAKPVIVDIDADTFNIDPNRIEAAVTARTRAIIPVHFAGLPCEMAAITAIAQRHGLKLIEDAAHALPASWKQRIIGCGTSDATVFSFYATKTITTGEGGMITFVDPAIAKRARRLRLHGISKDIFLRDGDANGRHWRYEVVAPGFKSNMSDIVASIGIVQLGRARALYGRRAQIWARYDAGLAGLPVLRPPHARADDSHAFHLYALRLCEEAPLDRDTFIAEMAKAGIECGVHFIPLHLHPYWRDTLGLRASMFPASHAAYEREVTLPLFTIMSDEQQGFIIATVRRLLS